ncbi:MAG: type VI secretion system tip protein TssI/VgrG [Planctomycetota bacterium]
MLMPTQLNRRAAIVTPLGPDALIVRRVWIDEQISGLFRIDLDLVSYANDLDFDKVLGQRATVRLDTPSGEARYLNGFIDSFVQTKSERSYSVYRATIVPWLWFLTRTTDCKIFQQSMPEPPDTMTVPDIIAKVFKDHGFVDFRFASMTEKHPVLDFCVQYRESAFAFVSRLMEEEGISYFFEHVNGKHTLVMTDSVAGYTALTSYDSIAFNPETRPSAEEEFIIDWTRTKEVQSGSYALNDFDFAKPRQALQQGLVVNSQIRRNHAHADLPRYDYPGRFNVYEDGESLARLRLEELQVRHEMFKGAATAGSLAAGFKFTLAKHPRDDQNREYLLTSVSYEIDVGELETGASDTLATETALKCSFTAIDALQPYRPARGTPKPMIQGVQTAIVVGPDGQEIYTDPDGYSRIKVHFHWDRHGQANENASCWIRVAQSWAGKQWGSIQIPRVGQEVLVEFIDGDPDRPIITGSVYNGDHMPPYALPKNNTQSGVKSRSSQGGGPDNFNELRFEDKKGSEEVYLHAEKALTVHVKGGASETIGSGLSTNAGGSVSTNAVGAISHTTDDNINDKAKKCISVDAGKDISFKSGGSYKLETNLGIHLKAMNFVAALIESGAKAAAEAIKSGAKGAATAGAGGGLDAAGAEAVKTAESGLAALSPSIEAGAKELTKLSKEAGKNAEKAEASADKAANAVDQFASDLAANAGPEVIAASFLAMADSLSETLNDAKKVLEGMLPKIPSIELWAMKDINMHALWSMTMSTKVRDISIEAKNKNVNVKGKREVNIEASTQNLNLKASKKNVVISGKDEVTIKAEDKNLVVEAGKQKVFVKAAKQIFLQCGKATISMSENGNIVIKGAKVNVTGSEAVQVKGAPIKLN